jgi:hypothetical protein
MPRLWDSKRLPWVILAIVLMAASAVCGFLYFDAVGKISGWIGLPQYEGYIPSVQRYATLWSSLALALPFLAALLLGLGREAGQHRAEISGTSTIRSAEVSHEWTSATGALMYLLRVAASALGSLGFMIVTLLVVSLLEKLGVLAR